MITLIQGGDVYAPEYLGKKDILITGSSIAAIVEPGKVNIKGVPFEILSAEGQTVVPGFIDSHVHILGGGGEGGPSTRAPEIRMEDIVESAVTTVFGCLGTDGTTRHMESLLAKAFGLEKEGINTWIFSGSYRVPPVSLTGSVRSDLILIEKVIGAGEIAVSDHRSSQPTFTEFIKLAADCRVGGMLGGKAGILHCHMGSGSRKMEYFYRLLAETEIPVTQLIPTHTNRNQDLLEDAVSFMRSGGYADLTAELDPADEEDQVSVASSIRFLRSRDIPLTQITISSDSNGSLPVFDAKGNLTGLAIATEKSLLSNFRHLVHTGVLPIEEALLPFCTNAAEFYHLKGKGKLAAGFDADLICLDRGLNLVNSMIRGQIMLREGDLFKKGTFSNK
ncbi:MAG: beta-aspartyl-peptidase [Candidatus Aminicenantes bacterium]|nr:beta-aspartyl-peptidase [Candidatus Aminicenantes bacterium]